MNTVLFVDDTLSEVARRRPTTLVASGYWNSFRPELDAEDSGVAPTALLRYSAQGLWTRFLMLRR